MFKRRIHAKKLKQSEFPIPGMRKIFVNKNLTKLRKHLYWKTQLTDKEVRYNYVWIWNGKNFVRENENMGAIAIHSDSDIKKL